MPKLSVVASRNKQPFRKGWNAGHAIFFSSDVLIGPYCIVTVQHISCCLDHRSRKLNPEPEKKNPGAKNDEIRTVPCINRPLDICPPANVLQFYVFILPFKAVSQA